MIDECRLLQESVNLCDIFEVRIEKQQSRLRLMPTNFRVQVYGLESEQQSPVWASASFAVCNDLTVPIGQIWNVALGF